MGERLIWALDDTDNAILPALGGVLSKLDVVLVATVLMKLCPPPTQPHNLCNIESKALNYAPRAGLKLLSALILL